jgi:outer membrane protein TolC
MLEPRLVRQVSCSFGVGLRGLALAIVVCCGSEAVTQARAGAEESTAAPLTLEDAIGLTIASSRVRGTSQTLRNATDLLSRGNRVSRINLATIADAEPQPGNPIRYTLNEEFTVDLTSAAARQGELRAVRADLAQAAASLITTRRAAASVALTAFFALAADQALTTAADDNLAFATQMTAAAEDRRRAANAPALDVDRMHFAQATAEADHAASSASVGGDRDALAAIVGDRAQTIALPAAPASLPDVAMATNSAIRASPAVVGAQAVLAANEAALIVARGALHNSILVGAGVGFATQGAKNSIRPTLGFTYAVPFATALTHGTVATAQAGVDVAQASLEQRRREEVQSVLRARTAVQSAIARVAPLQRALDSARAVAEGDLLGYKRGTVSSADLVSAQLQLATARSAVATANVQVLQTAAQLQLEMGAFGA